MRHHAEHLREQGWKITYTRYEDAENTGSLAGEIEAFIYKEKPEQIIITEPGEWRLKQIIERWENAFGVPVDIREDDRFICSHDAFQEWRKGANSCAWSISTARCAGKPAYL